MNKSVLISKIKNGVSGFFNSKQPKTKEKIPDDLFALNEC